MEESGPKGGREATLHERLVRGELLVDGCPSREILQHITSRRGVLALLALTRGVHRFSELQRKLGATERILEQTLQRLEADGLVQRVSQPVALPHVDYNLTPLGQEIAPMIESLAGWIEVNLQRILTAQHEHARRRQRNDGADAVLAAARSDDEA